jgi:hypothetical protein
MVGWRRPSCELLRRKLVLIKRERVRVCYAGPLNNNAAGANNHASASQLSGRKRAYSRQATRCCLCMCIGGY